MDEIVVRVIICVKYRNGWRYDCVAGYEYMIKNCANKENEKSFSRRLRQGIPQTSRYKLDILAAVEELGDLQVPPSSRLERLSDNREEQDSIRINVQLWI